MKRLLLVAALAASALVLYTLATAAFAQDDAGKDAPAAVDADKSSPAAGDTTEIDPAFEGDIRKLIELVGLVQATRRNVERAFAKQKEKMPEVPEEVWTKAIAEVNWEELVAINVAAYAKHLTPKDVKAAISFYESPEGKHFLAAQPKIAEDVGPQSRVWGQKIGLQVMQAVLAHKSAGELPKE